MTHIISCDINLKGIFVSVCSIIPIVFCTIWTKVLQDQHFTPTGAARPRTPVPNHHR